MKELLPIPLDKVKWFKGTTWQKLGCSLSFYSLGPKGRFKLKV